MQDPDLPSFRALALVEAFRQRFPRAELRARPTGQYNCHGMTFACRRTQVLEPSVVESILKDDGYHRANPGQVLAGDVALYHDANEIAHTGVVLEAISDGSLLGGGRAFKVMSKWGKAGEYIHYAAECPFAGEGRLITYWTERCSEPTA